MNLQNKNAIFNILGPIILNGIGFFTVPIFTRLLGPDQYGIVSVYNTWVNILAIVMGMQIQGSIGPGSISFKQEDLPQYISSIFSLGCLSSLVCFFLGFIFSNLLLSATLFEPVLLVFMGVQAFGTFVVGFASMVFVFQKEAKKSFCVNVFVAVTSAVLSISFILFVTPHNQAYLGKIAGMVIPYALAGILLFIYIELKGKWGFDFKYIKFCLPLCIPLIFHALSQVILGQSDRIMLQHMLGNASTGIYSFMIVFSGVLTAIWGALNNTWVPFYYEDVKAGRIGIILDKTKNYIFVFTTICIVFLLWAPEVIRVFVPMKFWESTYLLPYFVMSNYFTFLYSFPVNFEFYNKNTYLIAISTVFSAAVNIIFNFILIEKLGISGAAIATLISHIGLFLFHDQVARRVVKRHYHYGIKNFLPGMLFMILAVLVFETLFGMPIARWSIGFILFVMFWVHLYKKKRIF